MSNSPRHTPGGPRKKASQKRKIPLTLVSCIVNAIFEVNKVNDRDRVKGCDTIVILGSNSGREGKEHTFTLYGKREGLLDPKNTTIVGQLAHFQVRLITVVHGATKNESEQVGNIEGFYGSVDNSGRFTM